MFNMSNFKKILPILILLVCFTSFGVDVLSIYNNHIRNFDQSVGSWIQGFETPAITSLMKLFTDIGGGLPLIIIILLALFIMYRYLSYHKELGFLIGVMVGSTVLNACLKFLFHRDRPLIHRIIDAHGYSFPSGHSMSAFSFYGALSFMLWKHVPTLVGRIILVLISSFLILGIGISRIYLGVHYPSDIIGGYFVSASWLIPCFMLYRKYIKRE
ncbi:phospholipid phosphatase [Paenibacillus taichungensis]|uniref:Phospholipid phosphatase n=1 Tax=Paenibacillus taichungensis TaxID=484184 RepID=A0A329QC30_9BACL|nr:phosphatase PAP2 family protein [Paenibacillus taichungensis]RAW09933.1 phospholipid phosphatase [Paenibacillus taichungensis]